MFKTLLTLLRGRANAAGQGLENAMALPLLDQQMRDAAGAIQRAKRALALAIGQDQLEARRLEATATSLSDLEARARAALSASREDLAREAAEAIARLEADRDAALTAQALFAAEIARLKRHVAESEARLAQLDRGRRVARAAEAVRELRRGGLDAAKPLEATLPEAEETLARLRERQIAVQVAADAFAEIDFAHSPRIAAEHLAAQGFGPRLKPTAEDVLARLRGPVPPQITA